MSKYLSNDEYKFYALTLNSVSLTDTTTSRKQMNIAVNRIFIVAIVTIEQRQ